MREELSTGQGVVAGMGKTTPLPPPACGVSPRCLLRLDRRAAAPRLGVWRVARRAALPRRGADRRGAVRRAGATRRPVRRWDAVRGGSEAASCAAGALRVDPSLHIARVISHGLPAEREAGDAESLDLARPDLKPRGDLLPREERRGGGRGKRAGLHASLGVKKPYSSEFGVRVVRGAKAMRHTPPLGVVMRLAPLFRSTRTTFAPSHHFA